MKKFISMVMAAAMVVSLVPATAFAANTASIKVTGDVEYSEEEAKVRKTSPIAVGPEVRLTLTDVDATSGATADEYEIDLDFTNAEIEGTLRTSAVSGAVDVVNGEGTVTWDGTYALKEAAEDGDTSVTIVLTEDMTGANAGKKNLQADDVIVIDLSALNLVLTKSTPGTVATVDVAGDFGVKDDLVFATVVDTGLTATIKEATEIGVETDTYIGKKIEVESEIDQFVNGQLITMKLNKGFEFIDSAEMDALSFVDDFVVDENEAEFVYIGSPAKSFTIPKDTLKIEAVDAKEGDEAKLTIKAEDHGANNAVVAGSWDAKAEAIVIATVVADGVKVSVDEDEDVPEMWSGVDAKNYGLNAEEDEHWSLVVTVEENVIDAIDFKDEMEMTLTEGVFVTDVEVVTADNLMNYAKTTPAGTGDGSNAEAAFEAAYVKGDQESFVFARKTMEAADDAKVKLEFKLELVAEPGFEGDVVLTAAGQEVTIATFKAPYTVEAAQNDLIIDYRNTEVPTDVVITEAEEGLWNKSEAWFELMVDHMTLEDDATFAVNEESEMEIDEYSFNDGVGFDLKEESDDEAAVVTISDIALYMNRSLPAGAYDLELASGLIYFVDDNGTVAESDDVAYGYLAQSLYGAGHAKADYNDIDDVTAVVEDGTYVVKEAWINVITAGRDQDDASFTKKVVVPVGESYIVAGEETVTLDVPAYVSAAGYTMLPVRAVAVALGINTNNVLWDQATKTVTILYGQRIITMTVGSKTINVNGSAIPASASPEVVDGRTFLPMRDLATALGVTDITWDAATKTATLNGNI